jgi:hypothetical protein
MNKFNEVNAKIIFDPADLTRKHEKHSAWKKHVIAFIDEPDFCDYFSWFIKKRYNLALVPPIRGVHMTVVNDRLSDGIDSDETKYRRSKELYDGMMIDINYNTDVRTDGKYWWFNAQSNDALFIRQQIGLKPTPYFGFHITVARVEGREFEKEHGIYVHNLIKRYGLGFG